VVVSLIVVAVGVACAGFTAYAIGAIGRYPCPACGTKLLKRVDRRRAGGATMTWIESRYACESCFGEFMRRNKGPLVPRHLWEQGMRDGPPPAKLLR
jgi:transposase-like protein